MDKKLTDSEIVKALECCTKTMVCDCEHCPAENKGCVNGTLKLALNLINRQEAENDGLQTLVNLSIDTQNDLTDKLL